jgi:hypothetical protein
MLKLHHAAVLILAVALSACNAAHGPVLDKGSKPTNVKGTISGIVRTSAGTPLEGRKVTAVNLTTGEKFDATTAVNGGYTVQVTSGKYRLEVEVHEGERVSEQPAETSITPSDLDGRRNFVIAPK